MTQVEKLKGDELGCIAVLFRERENLKELDPDQLNSVSKMENSR